MRRPAPRPIAAALTRALEGARPLTLLARVQAAWPQVAGSALASVTAPVAERAGVVTVVCESAAWAQELELLQHDLTEGLARHLEGSDEGSFERFRFTVGSVPNRR